MCDMALSRGQVLSVSSMRERERFVLTGKVSAISKTSKDGSRSLTLSEKDIRLCQPVMEFTDTFRLPFHLRELATENDSDMKLTLIDFC